MKYALLLLLILTQGCTTVRSFDSDGHVIGMCRITGLLRTGGQCIGYSNGRR